MKKHYRRIRTIALLVTAAIVLTAMPNYLHATDMSTESIGTETAGTEAAAAEIPAAPEAVRVETITQKPEGTSAEEEAVQAPVSNTGDTTETKTEAVAQLTAAPEQTVSSNTTAGTVQVCTCGAGDSAALDSHTTNCPYYEQNKSKETNSYLLKYQSFHGSDLSHANALLEELTSMNTAIKEKEEANLTETSIEEDCAARSEKAEQFRTDCLTIYRSAEEAVELYAQMTAYEQGRYTSQQSLVTAFIEKADQVFADAGEIIDPEAEAERLKKEAEEKAAEEEAARLAEEQANSISANTLSENTIAVTEKETDSVSDNSVSDNSVSGNTVSGNKVPLSACTCEHSDEESIDAHTTECAYYQGNISEETKAFLKDYQTYKTDENLAAFQTALTALEKMPETDEEEKKAKRTKTDEFYVNYEALIKIISKSLNDRYPLMTEKEQTRYSSQHEELDDLNTKVLAVLSSLTDETKTFLSLYHAISQTELTEAEEALNSIKEMPCTTPEETEAKATKAETVYQKYKTLYQNARRAIGSYAVLSSADQSIYETEFKKLTDFKTLFTDTLAGYVTIEEVCTCGKGDTALLEEHKTNCAYYQQNMPEESKAYSKEYKSFKEADIAAALSLLAALKNMPAETEVQYTERSTKAEEFRTAYLTVYRTAKKAKTLYPLMTEKEQTRYTDEEKEVEDFITTAKETFLAIGEILDPEEVKLDTGATFGTGTAATPARKVFWGTSGLSNPTYGGNGGSWEGHKIYMGSGFKNPAASSNVSFRVLSTDGSTALLFADNNVGEYQTYSNGEEQTPTTWDNDNCNLRAYMNNTLYTWFTAAEKEIIPSVEISTQKNPSFPDASAGNPISCHLWALEMQDIYNPTGSNAGTTHGQDYGFTGTTDSSDTRSATDKAWWLRSPGREEYAAGAVDYNGSVDLVGRAAYSQAIGARPAFHIDLSKVLYACKYNSYKGSFSFVDTSADMGPWKLTLKDDNSTFAATLPTSAARNGYVTVNVTNMGSSTDYTQISAVMLDASENVVAYGRIGSSGTGNKNFYIPYGVNSGKYTLHVFPERVGTTSGTESDTAAAGVSTTIRIGMTPCMVTLAANGGYIASDASDSKKNFQVTAYNGEDMPVVNDDGTPLVMPTRNTTDSGSFTFLGFYDAREGGTKYYNADGTSARTFDKTAATILYAQWTYNGEYRNVQDAQKDVFLGFNGNHKISGPTTGGNNDSWEGHMVYIWTYPYRVLDPDTGLLFADDCMGMHQYHDNYIATDTTWEKSELRGWLNFNYLYNNGSNGYHYSELERSVIVKTFVENPNNTDLNTMGGNTTEDKLFLLSIQESTNPNYGFTKDIMKASNTRASAGWGDWMTRAIGRGGNTKVMCTGAGSVTPYGDRIDNSSYLRPALKIDTGKVLFAMANAMSKTTFAPIGSTNVNAREWRLTFNDGSTGFAATAADTNIGYGVPFTVTVTGKGTGTHSKTSAMLVKDAGKATETVAAYGWLTREDKTGTETDTGTYTFTLADTEATKEAVPMGTYSLKLFQETNNGTESSDGAGNVVDISNITVVDASAVTVTLDKNAETAAAGNKTSIQATYGSELEALNNAGNLPTRPGYEFMGYFDKDGKTETGSQYYNADGTVYNNLTSGRGKKWDKLTDTTLYAHWSAKSYTVKLDANEGTAGNPATQTVTYDSVMPALTSKQIPQHTNAAGKEAVFAGFFGTKAEADKDLNETGGYYKADGTAYVPTGGTAKKWDRTEENTSLYARWRITLTYNPNGAAEAAEYEKEMTVNGTPPSLTSADLPTRTGYVFTGYYTSQTRQDDTTRCYNGDGTAYGNSSGTKTGAYALDGHTMLYAGWKSLLKVKVPAAYYFAGLPDFSNSIQAPVYTMENLNEGAGVKIEAASWSGGNGSILLGTGESEVALKLKPTDGFYTDENYTTKNTAESSVTNSLSNYLLGYLKPKSLTEGNTENQGTFTFTGNIGTKLCEPAYYNGTAKRDQFTMVLKFTSVE